jgi:GDP-4-dehydro-6-deoxy-D-mannose reductase
MLTLRVIGSDCRAEMDSAPRRILVTGASGFVGRHLTASLRAAYPNGVLFTPSIDVRCAESVTEAVQNVAPEVCIHLAAISAVRAAEQNEDDAWDVNLHGTLRVARAILRYVPDCLMLFASSADAYGHSFRSGLPVAESTPLAPMNTYAATKAAADLALGGMADKGLRCVRFRPFNHTGPGQSDQFVVAAFARQVARIAGGLQSPLLTVGNIDTLRDFLDVRDVCAAYLACVATSNTLPPGAIINLASGRARRIRDILSDLQTLSGVEFDVQVDLARVRESDVPSACGDASLARQLLGWSPTIAWEQTLHDVLEDWRTRIGTALKET